MEANDLPLISTKVLLVEDDIVFQKQLQCYLQGVGALVQCSPDGEHCLPVVSGFQPNIILVDLDPCGVINYSILEHTVRQYPGIPVIVISRLEQMQHVTQIMRMGAYDILTKPLQDWQNLVESIINAKTEVLSSGYAYLTDSRKAQTHQAEFDYHLQQLRVCDKSSSRFLQNLLPLAAFEVNGIKFKYELNNRLLMLDYIAIDDDKVGLVVYDLSLLADNAVFGGLLLTYLINQPFRQYTLKKNSAILSPDVFLCQLNRQVHGVCLPGMLKVFYAVIDASDATVTWSSSGLLAELTFFSDGHGDASCHLTSLPGLPLGMMPNASYPAETRHIEKNIQVEFLAEFRGGLTISVQLS
ncbi:MAG: CheY-like chemotaxis protein [Moritella sp.]|jgi:CheY-like chemotaxis protein